MWRRFFTTRCYFDVMKMQRTFRIDDTALKFNYNRLQRKFDPDASKAYTTLKDPLKRAIYLYEKETFLPLEMKGEIDRRVKDMIDGMDEKELKKMKMIVEAEMLSLHDLINTYHFTKDYQRMKEVIQELHYKTLILAYKA